MSEVYIYTVEPTGSSFGLLLANLGYYVGVLIQGWIMQWCPKIDKDEA